METMKKIYAALRVPWLSRLLSDTKLCWGISLVAGVLGITYLFGLKLWPCMFANLTGLPCPGCGMTRAMKAMAQGQWSEALAFHPFSPFFLLFGLLVFLAAILPARLRARLVSAVRAVEKASSLPTLILLMTLTYGLLRMGGICSNHAVIKPQPVRAWLQERLSK